MCIRDRYHMAFDRFNLPQIEPHESSTPHRIEAVRIDGLEAERAVQRLRRLHGGKCVEHESFKAVLATDLDDPARERTAEIAPACTGRHVATFYFAGPFIMRAQTHASDRHIAIHREQHGTARWTIVRGKVFDLLVEILKAEIDAKARRVLLY